MYNIFKYSIGLTYSTFKLLDQIFSVSMRLPAFCKICDYLKCQWSKSLIHFIMIGPTRLRLRANSELIAAVRQTSCLVRKVNKYWEWCEAVVGTITGVISRVHPGLWRPQHPLFGRSRCMPCKDWDNLSIQTDQLWLKYQS